MVDEETRQQLEERIIQLADDPATNKPIDILIGRDHKVEFCTHNAIKLAKNLEVVETALGWTLFGCKNEELTERVKSFRQQATACLVSGLGYRELAQHATTREKENDELELKFKNFVEADALQLNQSPQETASDFHERFMSKVRFDEEEKRFVVRLPFKEEVQPAENKKLCLARLKALENRLAKEGLRKEYNSEFEKMLRLGFIEKVDECQQPGKVVSYLPHREVKSEKSLTTKLRIVFDASAREKDGCSLNEALHDGPNLNADLLGVILNFRRHKVTLMADIEKSFPQIVVHEDDRDALRLFWDPESSGRPRIFRLTRNYFGEFILAACIRTLLQTNRKEFPEVVENVEHSYYVDDFVMSPEDDEQAETHYEVTKSTISQGSFNLRKWLSSSERLMARFRKDEVSVEEFSSDEAKEFKVLGIRYNKEKDTLRLNKPKLFNWGKSLTKRHVLSIISSVFDRLGMIAPVTVRAKLVMQQIYKIPKMKWDDRVPDAIANIVIEWATDIAEIEKVEIPRRYIVEGAGEETAVVHLFADASAVAFGTVAYIVIRTPSLRPRSTFLMARSKVAPMENATIPRLELMALQLAAETCDYLRRQLRFGVLQYYPWTDSTGVFYQAHSPQIEKLSVFVRNRVTKIRALMGSAEIHHVPGNLNPADLVSRGCRVEELRESSWYRGPAFIEGDQSEWPRQPELAAKTVAVVKATSPVNPVFDYDRFNKWSKLRRSVAYVLRFIRILKKESSGEQAKEYLRAMELEQADMTIVRQIQKEVFHQEISCLRDGRSLSNGSKLQNLNPRLRDGLLCLGGRLGSHLGEVPKNPPILPPGHRATRLYLADLHTRHAHAGANQCLVLSRKRYWVPRGRQVLKSVIHTCANCKRFHLKPMTACSGEPPEFRVSKSAPFAHIGTDVAGPLYVVQGSEKRKVWVCVFTCGATRAVHLELLGSLSARDFLMSLRRFKARRGCPKTIFSDNATNYRRAAADLQGVAALLQDKKLAEEASNEGIEWHFNVEKAPWMNGFVERLVGILKSALKKVIGRQMLSYEELETVVCEVEDMMNRRPLCQVSDSENIEVLTPLHFLIAETENKIQDNLIPPKSRKTELVARWRHRKKVVEDVWKKWEDEYLSLLRNFHDTKTEKNSSVKVGQVVIIRDDQKPKLFWKLGRIEKINVGRDGIVRFCILRGGNDKVVQRPIKLLYPLELEDQTRL